MNNQNMLFTNSDINFNTYDDFELENTSTSIALSQPICNETLNKQNAVWTTNAILALMSLYKANKDMLDHPKKKSKLWAAIKNGSEDFGVTMTVDQVRWKMNALLKKYKECIDNNSKSGRGTMEFEWFNQMEEIFGKEKSTASTHTVSSNLAHLKCKSSTHTSNNQDLNPKKNQKKTSENLKNSPSTSNPYSDTDTCTAASAAVGSSLNIATKSKLPRSISSASSQGNSEMSHASSSSEKSIRTLHGTGSNIAKSKVQLEKQWLYHLKRKEEHDTLKIERYKELSQQKKEALQLKKRQLHNREKELEQRKQAAAQKIQDKMKRHAEIIEMENLKCRLLKKYLFNKENNTPDMSDSDD